MKMSKLLIRHKYRYVVVRGSEEASGISVGLTAPHSLTCKKWRKILKTTKKRLTLRLTTRKVHNETIIMKQEEHEIMTIGNNCHYKN